MLGIEIDDNNNVFLSNDFLIENGIERETIKKWTVRKTTIKKHFNGIVHHNVKSIPKASRIKIPHTDNELFALYQDSKSTEKENSYLKLLDNASMRFFKFKNLFDDKGLDGKDKVKAARKYSTWEFIISFYLTLKKGDKYLFYLACNTHFKKHGFNTYSKQTSFLNALSDARKDLVDFCIHGNMFNQNAKFTNELYEFMIQAIATIGSPKDAPAITAIANEIFKENGLDVVSIQWVKNWIRTHKIHLTAERLGQIKANKEKHYLSFYGVANPNNQWQVDGYEIKMYYKFTNKNGKVSLKKLWLIAVIDACTKKIMGYHIDTSENTEAIMKALNMAIKQHQCIAYELVSDNHSTNQTQLTIDFKARCEELGVTFTVTSNPQYKNKIERFFEFFAHSELKHEYGFAGEGVKSKNETAHISPELISEYIKSENCLTETQIIKTVVTDIERYNATPQKHGKSPNQLYNELEKPHQINIDDFERLRLLEPTLEYTVTRKQIDIKRGVRKYEFSMIDYPEYWGKTVLVLTDNDYETIYVADKDKGTKIAELKQKEKIHPDLASQTARDKELLAENARNHKKVKQISESKMKGIAEKAMEKAKEIGLDLTTINYLKNPKQALDSDADIQHRVDGILINNYDIDPKMILKPNRDIELKKSKILEYVKNADKPKEKVLNVKGSHKPIDLNSYDNL